MNGILCASTFRSWCRCWARSASGDQFGNGTIDDLRSDDPAFRLVYCPSPDRNRGSGFQSNERTDLGFVGGFGNVPNWGQAGNNGCGTDQAIGMRAAIL